jgi:predicted DNA-binding WGR domain protein
MMAIMPEILGLAVTPNGHVHTLETGGRIVRCVPKPAEVVHLGRERVDAFGVGPDGALHAAGHAYHTNTGGVWRREKVERKNRFASMLSIWAPNADEVWVGDSAGEVLHRDARGWTSMETGFREGQSVHFIGGSGPADVYIGGVEIRHFDGTEWRALEAPERSLFLDMTYFQGSPYFAGHDGLYVADGEGVRRVGPEKRLYALTATKAELFLSTGAEVLAWNGKNARTVLAGGGYHVSGNGKVVVAAGDNGVEVIGEGFFATAPKDAKPSTAKDAETTKAKATKTTKATKVAAPIPPNATFQKFRFFEQKFFDVAVVDAALVTRSGFIGKETTEKVKLYASAAAAEKARDALIVEKRSKGFRPV